MPAIERFGDMRNKILITEDNKQKITKMCNDGLSYRKIAKIFNVSGEFMGAYCRKNNIISKFKRKTFRTKEIDNLICCLYNDGYSSIEISKIINISKPCVLDALHSNNIIIKNKYECQTKHTFNDMYFNNIDCGNKAYWLGFLAGDGNIFYNKITINLAIKDENILKEFKKNLNASNPIRYYLGHKNSFGAGNKYCSFIITSYKLVNQLKKFNLLEKKSKTLDFNLKLIPEIYLSDFIRGLIDADGCFRVGKTGGVSLCLVGTWKSMETVQNILIEKCQINKTKLIKHHTTSEICYLEYHGHKQMQRIYAYLYSNANFYMERKHARIIKCFIKTNKITLLYND